MSLLRKFTRRNVVIVLAIVLVLVFSGQSHSIADDRTVEYKIKAAYLYNFLKFVWWPESFLATGQSEIKVCLLGKNQLDPYLEPMTNMTAQGHNITITHISNVSQAHDCQLLFVGASEANNLPQILEGLKDAHCLTVGEIENFAAKGGMIGFVLKEGRISLEINTKAVKEANLEISAKLLEVANIIK